MHTHVRYFRLCMAELLRKNSYLNNKILLYFCIYVIIQAIFYLSVTCYRRLEEKQLLQAEEKIGLGKAFAGEGET